MVQLHLALWQNTTRPGAGGTDQETLHHRHFLPGLHHEHCRLAESQGGSHLTTRWRPSDLAEYHLPS